MTSTPVSSDTPIAFIGGGNMAKAIVGGLRRSGMPGHAIVVIDPGNEKRIALEAEFGVRTGADAQTMTVQLANAALWVWAIKPQVFASAVPAYRSCVGDALQLSVMAGIRTDAIARLAATRRVVRAMPNTPALVGQGMTGLYAREGIDTGQRLLVESVMTPTGKLMWVDDEDDLDAVTAVSGCGPAYVFYLIEAMVEAAERMGLTEAQGHELAIATLAGSSALLQSSHESPAALRSKVTSKGGATHAAIESLDRSGMKSAILAAMKAARHRAQELGDESSLG